MTEFEMMKTALERTGCKIIVDEYANNVRCIQDRTSENEFWFTDDELVYIRHS